MCDLLIPEGVLLFGLACVAKHSLQIRKLFFHELPEQSIVVMPIHQSNVAIFNAASGKADRVGVKLVDGKRVRVFKSTGEEIKA